MIAEESGKWVKEVSRCRTRRELDALLSRIGEQEKIAVHPGEEPYPEIARKLGISGITDLGREFEAAVSRIRHSRR